MRREVLWRSVRRLLDPDVDLLDVAYMWQRRRLMGTYALAAGMVCGGGAAVFGFPPASILAIALAAAAIAASAATDYRVLAVTGDGLVLMTGGRIRQVATGVIEHLPASTTVEKLSNNLVISDWRVGGERYSVLRRFESTMAAIAARYRPPPPDPSP